MSSPNQSFRKVVEGAVSANRVRDRSTAQRLPQSSSSAIIPSTQPPQNRMPSPIPSSSRSMTLQSTTTWSNRSIGDNPNLPPANDDSGSPSTSDNPNHPLPSFTNDIAPGFAEPPPKKKVSPQSSVNMPALLYPSNSRLIPNPVGSKESATAARYRGDSNDLRLENMLRTEIASTVGHIQDLRASLHQSGDSYLNAHRDLAQDNKVLHDDVDTLYRDVHELEKLRADYDLIRRRLENVENQMKNSGSAGHPRSLRTGRVSPQPLHLLS
ncbi:hypothetical protein BDP27DRAFT_1402213 [Rhodocollybia butyracea]|uniref:Uncharacterized protein n=1 Tax=Rhodocollybia butyracea TaxID=206335 RepID=A0A9P5U8Q8_9AGAR|nr:hypothetical protein BDP27DRAFT_1402213 [Rhodocollybia butyracea]